MSTTCKDKQKFKTSEAATKSAMRTKGAINEFLKILDLPLFRKLNSQYSTYANKVYGIKERLFSEDGDKAVPNRKAFKQTN